MYNLLAITNRHLCKNDFLNQIEKICLLNKNPNYNIKIVLREKDLTQEEYKDFAIKVLDICSKYNTKCILHTFFNVALELQCDSIHLPLNILKENPNLYKKFKIIGVSTHSSLEAIQAQNLHASYITAGHIFETNCKKGLKGRGLPFLKHVVKSINIPVYAIGGIKKDNINSVLENGAFGACIMSGFMAF